MAVDLGPSAEEGPLTVDPAAPGADAESGRPLSPDGVADIADIQDLEAPAKSAGGTASPRDGAPPAGAVPPAVRHAKRLYLWLPFVIRHRQALAGIAAILLTVLVICTDGSLNGPARVERPLYTWDPGAAARAKSNDSNDRSNDGNKEVAATGDEPPAGPRWFRTTQPQYQNFLAFHEVILDRMAAGGRDDVARSRSAHALAGAFCAERGRRLCSYAEYCAGGRGGSPAAGRDADPDGWNTLESLETAQWAPFAVAPAAAAMEAAAWVQVGEVSESEGGDEDNSQGRCWTWGEWTGGREEGDVAAAWGEEHRRWILCCDGEA